MVTTFFYIVSTQAIIAMYMFICTAFRAAGATSFTIALVVGAGLQTGVFNIFGGIFMAPQDAPVWWQWLAYSCPTYYLYSAVLKVNFEGFTIKGACDDEYRLIDKAECLARNTGDVYLAQFGYEKIDVDMHALFIVIMWAFMTLGSYFFLHVQAGSFSTFFCKKDLQIEEHPMQQYTDVPAEDNFRKSKDESAVEEEVYQQEHLESLVLYTAADHDKVFDNLTQLHATLDERKEAVEIAMEHKHLVFNRAVERGKADMLNKFRSQLRDTWLSDVELSDEACLEAVVQIFSEQNKVATDTLSLAEFTQLCGVLGVAEEKDAPARFAEIDMDHNGELSVEEFCAWYSDFHFKHAQLVKKAEEEFEKLDSDHDGHLNPDEMADLLANVDSGTLTYDDILHQVDAGEDGDISKEEFTGWFVRMSRVLVAGKANSHTINDFLGKWTVRNNEGPKLPRGATLNLVLHGDTLTVSKSAVLGGEETAYTKHSPSDSENAAPDGTWMFLKNRLYLGKDKGAPAKKTMRAGRGSITWDLLNWITLDQVWSRPMKVDRTQAPNTTAPHRPRIQIPKGCIRKRPNQKKQPEKPKQVEAIDPTEVKVEV